MADKYVYTTPTPEDMKELASLMREEDRKEIVGAVGNNIEAECLHCLEASEVAYICKCEGVPLAAFGVIRKNPWQNIGVIWMLSTKHTKEHKIYAGKWTLKGIRAFMKDWDYLYNFVDKGNDETIKWLKWMGAKVYPPRPYGLYGNLYHKFTFGEGE